MATSPSVTVFGEVLFDCFPSGEQVLGGAPFNVAWHLQALGDNPLFISRVGHDENGQKILNAMKQWGMTTSAVQLDSTHPTGQVVVDMIANEPNYSITADCAYDYIDAKEMPKLTQGTLLYHGSLGLRNPVARHAFHTLVEHYRPALFLDINLRPPWWNKNEVLDWMSQATWVKLNEHELHELGYTEPSYQQAMIACKDEFELDQIILTRGAKGACVLTADNEIHQVALDPVENVIDTVGAGDAFTAVYLHGLINNWSVDQSIEIAQQFACRVVGLRGATTNDLNFYKLEW